MLLESVADYELANNIKRIANSLEKLADKGNWVNGRCDSCGFNYVSWALTNPNDPNYCPSCGKKMK